NVKYGNIIPSSGRTNATKKNTIVIGVFLTTSTYAAENKRNPRAGETRITANIDPKNIAPRPDNKARSNVTFIPSQNSPKLSTTADLRSSFYGEKRVPVAGHPRSFYSHASNAGSSGSPFTYLP